MTLLNVPDKSGQKVHLSFVKDVEPNEGGYYVEVYNDINLENKIDDFCIHPTDCDCSNFTSVEHYAREYVTNTEYDLNYKF